MRLLRRLLPLLLLLTGLSLRGAPESPPFRWQADIRDGRLTVAVEVADACYLYVSATSVAAEAAGTVVSPWREPEATEKYDEFFGRPERIYGAGRHEWSAPVDPAAAPFTVTVEYQGCRGKSSAGPAVCFMPETLQLTVEPGKDAAAVKSVGAAGDQEVADAEPDEAAGIGSFRIVRHAEGLMGVPEFLAFLRNDSEPTGGGTGGWAAGGFWAMILLALLGGLGLNLTPCVLPMIPVNLAIIGADGANWRTGAWRAAIYGAGMAVAYGVLGAAAVLTGARFGTLNSSAWFNWAIAGVFVVLALAMFDVFQLDFSRWSAKVDPTRMNWGRAVTSFLLGVVAALLAGACVAPVLIAVIVFSANWYAAGNFAGLLLPFVLGIGMALPWPFAGAGMAVLPKPGQWMVRIKAVFGVIILLAAGYYAYLGFTLLPGRFDADRELGKVKTALTRSAAEQRPVFIDFWASWCKNCREMEQSVLSDPAVRQELERFIVIKFQAEKLSDPAIRAFLDRFGFNGLPAFAIIEPESDGR